MKRWISITLLMSAMCFAAVLATALQGSRKHLATALHQVEEQHRVIDSLLNRRMTYIDVQMHVTDRSTSKVYGRYNTGTITLETSRRYILEIDSMNVKTR